MQARARIRLGIAAIPRRLLRDGRPPEERLCGCGEVGDEEHFVALKCRDPASTKNRTRLIAELEATLEQGGALEPRLGDAEGLIDVILGILTSGATPTTDLILRARKKPEPLRLTKEAEEVAARAIKSLRGAGPEAGKRLSNLAGHLLREELARASRAGPPRTKNQPPTLRPTRQLTLHQLLGPRDTRAPPTAEARSRSSGNKHAPAPRPALQSTEKPERVKRPRETKTESKLDGAERSPRTHADDKKCTGPAGVKRAK